MARERRRWANAEKQCIAWLRQETGRTVYSSTPDNLGTVVPAYKVTRVGGGQETDLEKTIDLEINTYAVKRGDLWDAVADIETAMDSLRANGTNDWYVDDVTEVFGHSIVESNENRDLVKATATYRVKLRPLGK